MLSSIYRIITSTSSKAKICINLFKKQHDIACFVSFTQPTVMATPKATKNGKPGYDDTTLPLMEKNQGLSECV